MSQPTPYTPTTDFSQQEANNASGRSTVNTAALDAEFAAIDTTLDQTLANIQLLQRDDGRLMDVSVEVHTLSPEVLNLMGGFNLRGAWLSNTDYAVKDLVSSGSYTYVCSVAHNSGPTFSETNWLKFGFAGSNDAAQAAAAAAVSANEAHISELAAAASASSASSSATTATTQAGLASSSATAADASADAAAISETNAANSESAAAASAASISIPGGMAMVLKDSAGVSYVEMSAGTTAQRPGSPSVGNTRFNTTLNADETWSGSAWVVAGNVTQTGVETLSNKTLDATCNIGFLGNGQCFLSKSGATLLLAPKNGNKLVVNGTYCTIPSAGVTLAAPATSGTLYYIYAYMSGATMTLEESTTAHATDSTTGVEIKSGDATRTLVGMARTLSSAWEDSISKRFVRSWFNRAPSVMRNAFTAVRSTTSGSFTEINTEIRCEWLQWVDDVPHAHIQGTSSNNSANIGTLTAIGWDGTADANTSNTVTSATGLPGNCSTSAPKEGLAEGYHYATLMGVVASASTGNWTGGISGIYTSLSVKVGQ